MRTHLAMATFSLFLVHTASAQTPAPQQGPTANSDQSQSEAQQSQAIRDELHKRLENAGFTDIEMIPSRFLVRAKDKSGSPVMLVINLHSSGDQDDTVGQGSSNE